MRKNKNKKRGIFRPLNRSSLSGTKTPPPTILLAVARKQTKPPKSILCTTRPAETQQEENEEGTRSIPNITPSPTAEPREHKVRFVSVGGFPLKSWKPSRQMALKPPSKKSTRPPQCMPQVYVSSIQSACVHGSACRTVFFYRPPQRSNYVCRPPFSRSLVACNNLVGFSVPYQHQEMRP